MQLLAQCAELAEVEGMTGLVGWVANVICSLGPFGVAALVALETFVPPIPSEIILPLAGFVAQLTEESLLVYILFATLGSVVGALGLYAVGALFGEDRVRWVLTKVPLTDGSDFDKANAWFAKYGTKAVFFGRLVPIVRSLVSLPAGVARMNVGVFLFYTTIGSLLWNSLLVGLGALLGSQWDKVSGWVSTLSNIVVLVVLLMVVTFVWTRRHRIFYSEGRGRSEADPGE